MQALRCTSLTLLDGVGTLMFGQNMLLNILIVMDIVALTQNQQLQTNL